jgi:hypothetical protein
LSTHPRQGCPQRKGKYRKIKRPFPPTAGAYPVAHPVPPGPPPRRVRDGCKRVRACRTLPRQGRRHTGSSGARWGDADAGRPCLPTSGACGENPQGKGETTAAWSLPSGAVGDGATPHQARSGRGAREGFLSVLASGSSTPCWRDVGMMAPCRWLWRAKQPP